MEQNESELGGTDSGCINLDKIRSKEKIMALKTGERYRCPDDNCGCEIEVTKGAPATCGGTSAPRCCCGKEMQKAG